jgi:hypothetical protein
VRACARDSQTKSIVLAVGSENPCKGTIKKSIMQIFSSYFVIFVDFCCFFVWCFVKNAIVLA